MKKYIYKILEYSGEPFPHVVDVCSTYQEAYLMLLYMKTNQPRYTLTSYKMVKEEVDHE